MKNKTTKKGFSMLENYLVLRYSFTKLVNRLLKAGSKQFT